MLANWHLGVEAAREIRARAAERLGALLRLRLGSAGDFGVALSARLRPVAEVEKQVTPTRSTLF